MTVENFGRHRYYKLKGAEVAQMLETLSLIAPQTPALRKTLSDERSSIRQARTCYDHLAGRLGVQLTQALIEKKIIVPDGRHYAVSESGEKWFAEFGIDLKDLRNTRRIFAKQCLDWTERKPHIAGILGASIQNKLFEKKWISRVKNSSRSIFVTVKGREMLPRIFDIKISMRTTGRRT